MDDQTIHPATGVKRDDARYWVNQVNTSQSKEVGAVANTIRDVFKQLQEEEAGGVGAVDQSLRIVDPERANTVHLVAVLRTLFRQRDRLVAWQPLVGAAHAAFKAKGMAADAILAGLMSKPQADVSAGFDGRNGP